MIKLEHVVLASPEQMRWFIIERWVPIKGYENYKINDKGVVINSKGHVLKPELSNTGYNRVSLSKHQKHKKFSVHRLVAEAFIPNPNKLPQINHKDENRLNNNYKNLEWSTPLHNLIYSDVIRKGNEAHRRKVLCITTGEIFNSFKEIEDKYGLSHSNLVACCTGRRKQCGGKEWKYIN